MALQYANGRVISVVGFFLPLSKRITSTPPPLTTSPGTKKCEQAGLRPTVRPRFAHDWIGTYCRYSRTKVAVVTGIIIFFSKSLSVLFYQYVWCYSKLPPFYCLSANWSCCLLFSVFARARRMNDGMIGCFLSLRAMISSSQTER